MTLCAWIGDGGRLQQKFSPGRLGQGGARGTPTTQKGRCFRRRNQRHRRRGHGLLAMRVRPLSQVMVAFLHAMMRPPQHVRSHRRSSAASFIAAITPELRQRALQVLFAVARSEHGPAVIARCPGAAALLARLAAGPADSVPAASHAPARSTGPPKTDVARWTANGEVDAAGGINRVCRLRPVAGATLASALADQATDGSWRSHPAPLGHVCLFSIAQPPMMVPLRSAGQRSVTHQRMTSQHPEAMLRALWMQPTPKHVPSPAASRACHH